MQELCVFTSKHGSEYFHKKAIQYAREVKDVNVCAVGMIFFFCLQCVQCVNGLQLMLLVL